MNRLILLISCFCITTILHSQTTNDRQLWLSYMDKIARPVLSNLAEDKLKEKMPVELARTIDNATNRKNVSYLEAFGRTLCGIAPWLNLEGGTKEEVALRNQYRQWSLKAIANTVNPSAKDYLQWKGGQPLVDASFVAFALIRCPWLWQHLDTTVKQQTLTALRSTRPTIPVYSNWILFSGMIEAFFCKYDYEYDAVRIEFAIREFANHWYVGDGFFSDGMNFSFDYYNSIVIHPGLANILDVVKTKTRSYDWFVPRLDTINKRYAVIQERMINTDGSYPVTGRSIVYRGGVFHHLSDISFRKKLPHSLHPAQVRGALTAVIKKTLESPSTFTKDGWLRIGLYGSQPDLADRYITTGSLYICTDIFLPLGLPDTDEFWAAPAEPWTSLKVWRGQDVPADHALEIR
ncbi:MAG: DUF2264 domain-containing protein [Chitinophagaceae bacterium]